MGGWGGIKSGTMDASLIADGSRQPCCFGVLRCSRSLSDVLLLARVLLDLSWIRAHSEILNVFAPRATLFQ